MLNLRCNKHVVGLYVEVDHVQGVDLSAGRRGGVSVMDHLRQASLQKKT